MLSALRSTLEDPSGAATTSGAAQEHSAPVIVAASCWASAWRRAAGPGDWRREGRIAVLTVWVRAMGKVRVPSRPTSRVKKVGLQGLPWTRKHITFAVTLVQGGLATCAISGQDALGPSCAARCAKIQKIRAALLLLSSFSQLAHVFRQTAIHRPRKKSSRPPLSTTPYTCQKHKSGDVLIPGCALRARLGTEGRKAPST